MAGNDELNVNRDFSFAVNLSGISAPSGNRNMEVPEGYYQGKITDMYVNAERNPNRVVIKVTMTDGAFAGVVRTHGLNMPTSNQDKVRYYWRGMAESAGYTPTQLDKGEITMGRDTFLDRTVCFHYVPKDKSTDGYEAMNFYAPADWAQKKQLFDLKNNGGSSSPPPSVAAPVLGGGNTTTKADVLSKLGLGG